VADLAKGTVAAASAAVLPV